MSLKILESHLRANAVEVSEQLSSNLRQGVNQSADKAEETRNLLKTMDQCITALSDYQKHKEIRG